MLTAALTLKPVKTAISINTLSKRHYIFHFVSEVHSGQLDQRISDLGTYQLLTALSLQISLNSAL